MTSFKNNIVSLDTAPVLKVAGLTVALPKSMDRAYAVRDISFELKAGEILCIIGESGSGKSVTANTIMGLLPPRLKVVGGNIEYKGQKLLGADETYLRGLRGQSISMIFQDPMSALNPLMTIGEQIEEVMVVHNIGDAERREAKVLSLIEEVGLPNPETIRHQHPFRLSGGQRQRVMIAMALALDPDVLIADEPTTALDVTTQAQILALIRTIQERKKMSVMFITHDFGVVSEIAHRVVVMEKGELVEQGDARQVLQNPQHPYTQKLVAAVPKLREDDGSRTGDETQPVVIEVKNLKKVYGLSHGLFRKTKGREIRAVDDVSFVVRKGKTLGIVGESGSGKTSVGRLLLKLVDTTEGQILFQGQDIVPLKEKDFRPLRPAIQMIFQDPISSLNPRHSVGKILTVGPVTRGMSADEARRRAEDMLDLVELDRSAYERFPHEFSGGQRQRIGIARALMFEPALLVADESVSALDVSIQKKVLELLREVQQRTHVAMLFITHDLRVASQMCDDIIVMHRGKVVERGAPERLFRNPEHDYTKTLVAAIPGA